MRKHYATNAHTFVQNFFSYCWSCEHLVTASLSSTFFESTIHRNSATKGNPSFYMMLAPENQRPMARAEDHMFHCLMHHTKAIAHELPICKESATLGHANMNSSAFSVFLKDMVRSCFHTWSRKACFICKKAGSHIVSKMKYHEHRTMRSCNAYMEHHNKNHMSTSMITLTHAAKSYLLCRS